MPNHDAVDQGPAACRGGGGGVWKLRMSEIDEDYPSDTGDDRFSAVGEDEAPPNYRQQPHPVGYSKCRFVHVAERHMVYNFDD